MSEADGRNEGEMASAARELFLLGQKTVEARAVLAALQQDLIEAKHRLGASQQVEHLVEANQQLVLAMLSSQSKVQAPPRGEQPSLYLELREANEQLVIAALSAQSLQGKAEHALGQQKSILAMVAHELRNPLTPISMIAERMVRVASEELPRMQALIEGQVQHMSRLVDDLLDVSRADTGKLRLNCSVVDMIQTISEAIDACRPVMNAQKLHFSAHLPNEVLMVKGDPVRLAQVLHNLLANAAKYTQADGIVKLSVTAESNVLKITISDNGIGVSAKALPFIFDPYVQDVHAVGFNGSGLGIGLTVVRELVEAHGGKVIGKSEGDGRGSEFVVTLPLVSR
ncbi:MAG: two-component sensor histidine kinase [Pseudomonas sp.]|nr:two-component sensor histidine kinase [Pseudomonas sp.]